MTTNTLDLSEMPLLDRRRIARLIHESKADWVVLVGSWARGTQTTPTSDIDILVGARPGARQRTHNRMHVFYIDDTELRARVADGDDVAVWFLKFGVPLSGAEKWHVLRDSLLHPLPRINVKKKLDLAEQQFRYADALLRMGDAEAAQEELGIGLEHVARALLIAADVFPASRPEIPDQLRSAGYADLAELIDRMRATGMNDVSVDEAIRLASRLAQAQEVKRYGKKLRADPEFARKSRMAQERLAAGPPWNDDFSPSELLEAADRPKP